MAFVDTIAASHTARQVHRAVLKINSRSFAVLRAERTLAALVFVNLNAEERETREETEDCSYRTNGIAVRATMLPSEHSYDAKRQQSYNEGRYTSHPNFRFGKHITVKIILNRCQTVDEQIIQRAEEREAGEET